MYMCRQVVRVRRGRLLYEDLFFFFFNDTATTEIYTLFLHDALPIYADGLVVFDGHLNHGAEIVVGLAADVGVAGIDPVLGQGASAVGVFLQKDVTVVVEVADDGDRDAELAQGIDDPGHRGGSLFGVHGDADQFRTGAGQRHHLVDGTGDVHRIGVGHGLHHDRMIAPDLDTSDVDYHRFAAGFHSHWFPPLETQF